VSGAYNDTKMTERNNSLVEKS